MVPSMSAAFHIPKRHALCKVTHSRVSLTGGSIP
jgi:hypothetical protein